LEAWHGLEQKLNSSKQTLKQIMPARVQGTKWVGTILLARLACARHKCFFSFSSLLCIAWWPLLHPTYKTTFSKSSILCRWSRCIQQFTTEYPICDCIVRLQEPTWDAFYFCHCTMFSNL